MVFLAPICRKNVFLKFFTGPRGSYYLLTEGPCSKEDIHLNFKSNGHHCVWGCLEGKELSFDGWRWQNHAVGQMCTLANRLHYELHFKSWWRAKRKTTFLFSCTSIWADLKTFDKSKKFSPCEWKEKRSTFFHSSEKSEISSLTTDKTKFMLFLFHYFLCNCYECSELQLHVGYGYSMQ